MIPREYAWPVIAACLVGLVLLLAPAARCYVRRTHRWTRWEEVSSITERRGCLRCGGREWRDTGWLAELLKHERPPSAETADASSASCETGTSEIPRLSNGALASMPMPPRASGPGRVVLDHGPLSTRTSSSPGVV